MPLANKLNRIPIYCPMNCFYFAYAISSGINEANRIVFLDCQDGDKPFIHNVLPLDQRFDAAVSLHYFNMQAFSDLSAFSIPGFRFPFSSSNPAFSWAGSYGKPDP